MSWPWIYQGGMQHLALQRHPASHAVACAMPCVADQLAPCVRLQEAHTLPGWHASSRSLRWPPHHDPNALVVSALSQNPVEQASFSVSFAHVISGRQTGGRYWFRRRADVTLAQACLFLAASAQIQRGKYVVSACSQQIGIANLHAPAPMQTCKCSELSKMNIWA